MQLYLREKQLALLQNIFDSVESGSNFIVVSGRKKVGKSTMIAEYFRQCRGAYIAVSSRPTRVQLNEISGYFRSLHMNDVPDFTAWQDIFRYLFFIGKDHPVNFALDDIHHLAHLEPEIFSALPELWKKHAPASMLNFIAISDEQTFIEKYFTAADGPLAGIERKNIFVTPFSFPEVAHIMQVNDSILPLQEIVKIYLVFGGLPKYYALFEQFNLWNSHLPDVLRELVFRRFAPLYFDMKEMLYKEFRSGDSLHFRVLESMAAGNMTLGDISRGAGMTPTSVMKYLHELEFAKERIKRKDPLSSNDYIVSRSGRYVMANYFENFWFRFVQPDILSYELGHFAPLLQQTLQGLPLYLQGRIKLLIRELLVEFNDHPFVRGIINFSPDAVGSSWTRSSSVDLAARSSRERRALLGAVMHSPLQYSIQGMREFNARMLSVGKLFPDHHLDHLIVGWENPGISFYDVLMKSGAKHLLIHDLLELVPYRARAIRAIRSKAARVRILEPVSSRVSLYRVREEQA